MESSKAAPTSTSAQQSKLPLAPLQTPPPNRSFSRSAQIGHVQMRVYMAGMKDPILFRSVPINQHTRLPHHRPPLRRDKSVRISLPDHPPRYIFPAVDRSFIFIPRALRPNQQGFGRGRGRGSFSGVGGFASGRNSIYGGSGYSPSVAMSRRSSMAREVAREAMVSPAGSVMSRTRSNAAEARKPVVRLPSAGDHVGFQQSSQHPSYSNSPASMVNLPQQQAYPLPQKPLSQNWSSTLPMHQPRPQKQVSVADIETPATLNFNPLSSNSSNLSTIKFLFLSMDSLIPRIQTCFRIRDDHRTRVRGERLSRRYQNELSTRNHSSHSHINLVNLSIRNNILRRYTTTQRPPLWDLHQLLPLPSFRVSNTPMWCRLLLHQLLLKPQRKLERSLTRATGWFTTTIRPSLQPLQRIRLPFHKWLLHHQTAT